MKSVCLRTLAAIFLPCLVICAPLRLSAGAQSEAQATQVPENQQTNTPATVAQPQSPPASSQGCEQKKDTCELPPEPGQPANPPKPQTDTQTQTSAPKSETPVAPKTANKKKGHKKKHVASSGSGPRKIVVRDGGTSEPKTQLSPLTSGQQVSATRQNTDQLLASTQANLKAVSARKLTTSEEATVEQIKMFIEQANSALKEGDMQRGHNLAMKAHLLSDDLLRH